MIFSKSLFDGLGCSGHGTARGSRSFRSLHPHTSVTMNRAQAEAILAETLSKVKSLESEIDSLTGKENKKARNARSRVIAEMKKDCNFMDAERIILSLVEL